MSEKIASPNQEIFTQKEVDQVSDPFPLFLAARHGHTDCVIALLEKGANPNQSHEGSGDTPLLWAANKGHTNYVTALLEKGGERRI